MDVIVYGNELYHHGILGQKWGVRRYQNEDGSLTSVGRRRYGSLEKSESKANNSKGLVKQYHNYNAATKRAEIERANKVIGSKGIGNKFSEAFGYGNMATKASGKAEYYDKNSKIAKTRYGRKYNEAAAYNNNSIKNYADLMRTKSTGLKVIENTIFAKNLMDVPIKTIAGRKTTIGKHMALNILTAGVGTVVLDASYTHGQKKAAKAEYKTAKANIKSEWKEAANKYVNDPSDNYDKAADKYIADMKEAKEKYKRSY